MPDVPYHIPVMLNEVVTFLRPLPGKIILDGTLGGGGHAKALVQGLIPGGMLIGVDQDPDAIAEAKKTLQSYKDSVRFVQARFDTIGDVLENLQIEAVDGVLFDLGVSSHQLDKPERGFSFKEPDASLDMRMNPAGGGLTAADLLNNLSERELTLLIRKNSDERWAARVAQFIIERREKVSYHTVGQLVETVLAAIPAAARPPDKHAATRTFQALRIAVNDELAILEQTLERAVMSLKAGGVIVVLSYHSLEDRTVKQLFSRLAGRGEGEGPYGERPTKMLELLTKRPLSPTPEEVVANPRARSACLRAAQRLPS